MTDSFDTEDFLDWLDEQEGAVKGNVLVEEYPNFPGEYMGGCTGAIVDGELAYYQWDLRRAAEKIPPRD